jgi:hypothetical protein
MASSCVGAGVEFLREISLAANLQSMIRIGASSVQLDPRAGLA